MLRFLLVSIIWTFFVIIMSLIPSSNIDLTGFQIEVFDKIIHFFMYFFLTLFWTTGLKRQNISNNLQKNAFKISVLGGFSLSLILEILQNFITETRAFELLDLLANGIGCIFGALLFLIIYPNYKR
ncbi:MAG: VanZ family protein [Brumimicrobium sp.]